jgi:hypothetical protein
MFEKLISFLAHFPPFLKFHRNMLNWVRHVYPDSTTSLPRNFFFVYVPEIWIEDIHRKYGLDKHFWLEIVSNATSEDKKNIFIYIMHLAQFYAKLLRDLIA